ncbi:hypothetical protein [Mycobacterium sp. 1245852.3]|uniref:hypothetical protein n=1 Tax=Mycobacterium sp. 1245852.3 TaxID=1856860 RepID=UPI0018D27A43|nr:hypothetical protein [Mycobacterium sp. 1245852.3]
MPKQVLGGLMASPIEQLIVESQEQYRRYYELYGARPVTGTGFLELARVARSLSQNVQDAREGIRALRFSSAVIDTYSAATAADHQPLEAAARAGHVAAHAADGSAEINVTGAADILGIAREETAQIAAVPDPDSAEGQTAIVAIISKHQSKAAQTLAESAAKQQALGQQAAGAGEPTGAKPLDQKVPTSPDDTIINDNGGKPHISLVDSHTGPSPQPVTPGTQPQIGPFPVPPQVAAAAQPLHPGNDPLTRLLLPSTAPAALPEDAVTAAMRQIVSAPHTFTPEQLKLLLSSAPQITPGEPLFEALTRLSQGQVPSGPITLSLSDLRTLVDAEVSSKLSEAEKFSLDKMLFKAGEGCLFAGGGAAIPGLLGGPFEPLAVAGACVLGGVTDAGKYAVDQAVK